MSKETWQQIAGEYEAVRSSGVSLDTLIEWPAQRRMIGDVADLHILDLGCGNGAKTIELLHDGAKGAVGIDVVDAFMEVPDGLDMRFLVGDISDTADLVGEQTFDLVLIFQATDYARDPADLYRQVAERLNSGGRLIVATSHPFRFAVARAEAENVPLGVAYRDTSLFSYPATWGEGTVTHRTETITDKIQPVLNAGLRLERVDEPGPTEVLRQKSPERAEWMDTHFGSMILEFRKP